MGGVSPNVLARAVSPDGPDVRLFPRGRCNGEGAGPDTTCTLDVDEEISLRGFRII